MLYLLEPAWDMLELRVAIRRLKAGKCRDERGLTAALLKTSLRGFAMFASVVQQYLAYVVPCATSQIIVQYVVRHVVDIWVSLTSMLLGIV